MEYPEFLDVVRHAFDNHTCSQLVLSRPGGGATHGHRPAGDLQSVDSQQLEELRKVTVRPVIIRGQRLFQFSSRKGAQEVHENLGADAAAARVAELFGAWFRDCHLYTTEADFSCSWSRKGRFRCRRQAPSRPQTDGVQAAVAPATSHDRTKQYIIPEGVACPFLEQIGVMTAAGRVRASRYQKFRQINRFLELIHDVVRFLPQSGRLNVVDFGCGKSYLTFALHHLLTDVLDREVCITGLDWNASVIEDCRRVASRLGCRGLEFHVGDIAGWSARDVGDRRDRVHLAVSLHACDTATDAALAQAIRWQTDVILAVPCCQHELMPQLQNATLEPLLKHGILRERFAALATDALRAHVLECRGYRTQVLEFIDLEHTAKNLMIRAVRREEPAAGDALHSEYRALKRLLNVSRFALEDQLNCETGSERGLQTGSGERA